MSKKPAAPKPIDKEKIEIKENFQAVLLADTYITRLAPITLETPKCLLPVGNVPLIEYSLSWLQANKINEVLIVYTAHKDKIEEFFAKRDKSSMKISLVHAQDAKTLGDALREVQDKGVVYGDFLLCYGDMITNVRVQSAIRHFLYKKKEDSLNIMTAVLRKADPMDSNKSNADDNYTLVVSKQTSDILQIEKMDNEEYFELNLERLKVSRGAASGHTIHYNLVDPQIYVCSTDVLKAFQENFTFNSFREDFVKEILTAEINEEKISSYIIPDTEFILHASDPRLYYKINQAVLKRHVSPFTLNRMHTQMKSSVLNQDFNIYMSKTANISYSTQIGNNSCVGDNTTIGEKTTVNASVIGKGCTIGANVVLTGSVVLDNVILEDNCVVKDAIICSNAIIKSGAHVRSGSIISFNVIVGSEAELPPNTICTTFPLDSEAMSEGAEESALLLEKGHIYPSFGINTDGMVGFDQHDIQQNFEDDSDLLSQDDEDSEADFQNRQDAKFQNLAEDIIHIIQDAIKDPSKIDHGTVEIHNLKVAENSESWRCIQVFLPEVLSDLLKESEQPVSASERVGNIKTLLSNWLKLFKKFVHSEEDALTVILEIEKFCVANRDFYDSFHIFLQLLFQDEILTKEYMLHWVGVRRNESTEDQNHFMHLCGDFIEWLENDDEDEEDDEEEDEGEENDEE